MSRRLPAISTLIATLLLGALAIDVNADDAIGGFGSETPYFSRTTNIDKWADPLPFARV